MKVITKIIIKGSSGYGCYDDAYQDKLTITEDTISYEYLPYAESETNSIRKWHYKTNNPSFRYQFEIIAKLTQQSIEQEIQERCTDIGGIEFSITYSDKTKLHNNYWVTGDYFRDLFRAIKVIIPETEYTPVVLLTNDDYFYE